METKVEFILTLVGGEQVRQEMACPDPRVEDFIKIVLAQYVQIGMVKKEGSRYTLIPRGQMARVEAEVPLLSIATGDDAMRVVQTSKEFGKAFPK